MGREDSHYRADGGPGPENVQPGPWQQQPPQRPGPPPGNPSSGRPPPPPYRPPAATERAYPPRVDGAASYPVGPDRPYPPSAGRVYPSRPAGPPGFPAGPPAGADPRGPGAGPPPGSDPPAAPPGPAPRRRRRLLMVLAVVLLLAITTVGLVIVRPGPVDGWLGGSAAAPRAADTPAEPSPVPVLAEPATSVPAPTPDGVRAVLDPLVRAAALGDRVNVSVVDVSTGTALYGNGPDTVTVPASVTKLVTAVTALAARGPGYRIPTRVVAGQNPGEVVIIGGGDPTLAVNATGFYPGAARLDQLADQVRKALGGVAPTRVTVDPSLFPGQVFGPGWDADIPTGGFGGAVTALMTDGARRDPEAGPKYAERFTAPDLAAGEAFARVLGLSGAAAKVKKGTAPAAPPAGTSAPTATPAGGGTAPAPGTELGRVESPPMVRLVDIMISSSDNIIAECLARQVALARDQPGSFTGAAAAMDAVVAELGLPADELTLSDGSGLSRDNRISPSLLTDLLVLAGNGTRPELTGVFSGLPVAGWSGTLAGRYDKQAGTTAGAGVVRAKTGTLTGVHAISGLVTTADGRLLAFAVLTDRVPGGSETAQPALDRITAALAGCGCR